jgi:uncharacterized protein (TIGR00369 family)
MAIVNRRGYDPPLQSYLGLALEESGDGASRVTLPLRDEVRGAVAPVHGGVLATLADVACAAAIGDYDGSTSIPVSVDLHLRFFRQPKESPLLAQGRVVHRGSRVIGAECTISDGVGREVARAAGMYMVLAGFGSLSGAGSRPT